MPKASVIIPVYNVAPYLKRCLDSVINQTLKDIEIICINDCSTDNSLEILKEYASGDNRIIIIDFNENKGVSVARNKGIKTAKGEYIGFVDSDDYIDLDFYEKLYNRAKETNAEIVKGNVKKYDINGSFNCCDELNQLILAENKFFFTYNWWSAIYKTSLIFDNNINFPVECRKGQDIVFLFKSVLNTNKISIVDDTYYHYIRREDSLDIGKLSFDKVKSNLNAVKHILLELNNSKLYNTEPDLYIVLYEMHLRGIFYPAFKNKDLEAELECAKYLVELYNLCKDIKKLDESYLYPMLLPFIKDNEIEELAAAFLKYNSFDKMYQANIFYKLRNNVIRNKTHE